MARWLWVPAFAGTTCGKALRRSAKRKTHRNGKTLAAAVRRRGERRGAPHRRLRFLIEGGNAAARGKRYPGDPAAAVEREAHGGPALFRLIGVLVPCEVRADEAGIVAVGLRAA